MRDTAKNPQVTASLTIRDLNPAVRQGALEAAGGDPRRIQVLSPTHAVVIK